MTATPSPGLRPASPASGRGKHQSDLEMSSFMTSFVPP